MPKILRVTGFFLATQQVQSYFLRQAGKLRHQQAEDDSGDHEAAVEQQQYWETGAQYPVTYDNYVSCEQAESAQCFHVKVYLRILRCKQ